MKLVAGAVCLAGGVVAGVVCSAVAGLTEDLVRGEQAYRQVEQAQQLRAELERLKMENAALRLPGLGGLLGQPGQADPGGLDLKGPLDGRGVVPLPGDDDEETGPKLGAGRLWV